MSESQRAGTPLDPYYLLRAMQNHARWIVLAGLLGVGLGAVASWLAPRRYEAIATLGPQASATIDGAALDPSALEASLRRVGLPTELVVRGDVQLELPTDRTVAHLHARGATAVAAAERANMLAEAMVARDVERVRQSAIDDRRIEDDARRVARERLARVRESYDAFRLAHHIVDLETDRTAAIARAAELLERAHLASADASGAEARVASLHARAEQTPQAIVAAAPRLAEARAERESLRGQLTDDHPRIRALELEIEALASTRGATVQNPVRREVIAALIASEAALAESRESAATLRALAEEAARDVAELGDVEGEASLLLAEVHGAETALREHETRIAALDDRLAASVGSMHVLIAAAPPESALPSGTRWLPLVIAPFVSVLVALIVAFLRERKKPVPRSAPEVAYWAQMPVIGTTTWPRDPAALDALVAELEDVAASAAGQTIVVPATEAERELAQAFAARLAEAPWLAGGVIDVEESTLSEYPGARPSERPSLGDGAPRPPSRDGLVPATATSSRPESSGPLTLRGIESPTGALVGEVVRDVPRAPESRPKRVTKAAIRLILERPKSSDDLTGDGRVTMVGNPSSEAVFSAAAPLLDRQVITARTVRVGTPSDMPPSLSSRVESIVRVVGAVHVTDRPVPSQHAVVAMALCIVSEDAPESARQTLHDLRNSAPAAAQQVVLAWNGPLAGPTLRRACRIADRVIVIVREGTIGALSLAELSVRLGREDGVGVLITGIDDSQVARADRVGAVREFWTRGTTMARRLALPSGRS